MYPDTPAGLSQIFSFTMFSVSLSSLLRGPLNVATIAKVQSRTQILAPSKMHVDSGLKWSFPHFHWPVRTADVAKQSCPHVPYFSFPFLPPSKKGVELPSCCAIFIGNKTCLISPVIGYHHIPVILLSLSWRWSTGWIMSVSAKPSWNSFYCLNGFYCCLYQLFLAGAGSY